MSTLNCGFCRKNIDEQIFFEHKEQCKSKMLKKLPDTDPIKAMINEQKDNQKLKEASKVAEKKDSDKDEEEKPSKK